MKLIKFLKIFLCLTTVIILAASCADKSANRQKYPDIDTIVKNLIDKGRYKEAADIMNREVIKNQEDLNNRINIAWIYAFNKHYKEALDITDKIIKLDPNKQEIYYLRGFIFQKTEDYQMSANNFKKALSLNPKDIKSISALADVLQTKENYDESMYYYTQASMLEPQNYIYYLDIANIYFKKNDYAKAQINAQKAYDCAPQTEKENVSDILENIKLNAIIEHSNK